MTTRGNNYTLTDIGSLKNLLNHNFKGVKGKYFIGNELGLSGSEVSLNCLPAEQAAPFVHAHKKNEELYIFISGNGKFFVDGEEFPVQEGSLIRVAPSAERAWTAGDKDLYFICIQAQEDSLTQATSEDGIRLETKTSWM
ncbi:mannose-6-phosphate isomerase-like protein (cupin superfamily) [Sporomusaceae bacterium BoRhaA]|uniref:cupin domain-containing protein n=1 Tax=Pelorhabdus rhamnosifermentans TaxID=2772457 RepID=UPI001C0623EF|nr:cupin domain-containing protein [Pelorhabdus rhamnosifermentans]MBU2699311.1 mannose-6-phosphate isomerase-like protein (cupin superfamily) [Pelorhabdus rhamnosifermentans]